MIRRVRCICIADNVATSIKPKLMDGFMSSIQYTQYFASSDLCICISPLPCNVNGAHSSIVSFVMVVNVLDSKDGGCCRGRRSSNDLIDNGLHDRHFCFSNAAPPVMYDVENDVP